MSDEDLLALISQYEKASLGSEVAAGATVGTTYYSSSQLMTTLEIDRFNALNMYYARPLGNEVENSSQVVIPELRDTVEWIMPQLMRIFAAARTPCVFEPESEDDVDQADLETEAVRHIFFGENQGFMVLHDYVKDALLLRNAYIKVYLEERKKVSVERYSELTHFELTEILADNKDETIEVLEQREYEVDMPPGAAPQQSASQMPQGSQSAAQMAPGMPQQPGAALMPQMQPGMMQAPQQAPQMPGQPQPSLMDALSVPATVFDIKIRRTKDTKRICVECVPPEEMLVSPRARTNLDASPFCCHRTLKARSDLIMDGYDETIVNGATAGRPRWLDMDALARDVVVDQMSVDDPSDFSMQELELRDVSIRVDYDGDGVAELRRVLIAGEKIIENEEIEEVPIASGAPIRMPHRHTGLSMYDLLSDIQVIKSELMRQGLNNLRLSNNGRTAVDYRNCEMSDLMDSQAGGLIRTKGDPHAVLMQFEHPSNMMEQVIPTMEYVDSWREMRTGVGKDTVGVDAEALQNVTKGGQLAGMAAASLKTELIARCLAEGLKDAFMKIRALMVRHQDQPLQFQMRGKWVNVDPTQWRERTRVSPNVGLGSGTREESRQNLMLLGTMQEKIASMGLIGPKQAYETFKRGALLLGFEQPERFAMDPDSDEFKEWQAQHPPQPNPAVVAAQTRLQAAQAQAQAGVQKAQIAEQAASQRAQAEVVHSALQSKEDRAVDMAGLDSQMFIALVRAIAPIVAAQLKGDPSVNAGAVLRADVGGLEGHA
jgi:hypothetical protein